MGPHGLSYGKVGCFDVVAPSFTRSLRFVDVGVVGCFISQGTRIPVLHSGSLSFSYVVIARPVGAMPIF